MIMKSLQEVLLCAGHCSCGGISLFQQSRALKKTTHQANILYFNDCRVDDYHTGRFGNTLLLLAGLAVPAVYS